MYYVKNTLHSTHTPQFELWSCCANAKSKRAPIHTHTHCISHVNANVYERIYIESGRVYDVISFWIFVSLFCAARWGRRSYWGRFCSKHTIRAVTLHMYVYMACGTHTYMYEYRKYMLHASNVHVCVCVGICISRKIVFSLTFAFILKFIGFIVAAKFHFCFWNYILLMRPRSAYTQAWR